MTAPPLMKCGHAANGLHVLPDGTKEPSCVICAGIPSVGDGYKTVDESPPSLEGRMSRCSYYKPGFKCACGKDHCPPNHNEQHGGNYPAVAPSSTSLPFFSHRPDNEFDQHFCGCWGWD